MRVSFLRRHASRIVHDQQKYSMRQIVPLTNAAENKCAWTIYLQEIVYTTSLFSALWLLQLPCRWPDCQRHNPRYVNAASSRFFQVSSGTPLPDGRNAVIVRSQAQSQASSKRPSKRIRRNHQAILPRLCRTSQQELLNIDFQRPVLCSCCIFLAVGSNASNSTKGMSLQQTTM